MSIGDINSTARGSGARFNDGKAPVELYPIRMLAEWADATRGIGPRSGPAVEQAIWLLYALATFQERVHEEPRAGLEIALRQLKSEDILAGARVFGYGRKKYAAWNWAKGMPWSVPLACAVRHLLRIIDGEDLDAESGEPHIGHVTCNVTMLWAYADTFREGDDRPAAGLLRSVGAALETPPPREFEWVTSELPPWSAAKRGTLGEYIARARAERGDRA